MYQCFAAEGDLRVFVGLASEWEDRPTHREEIEASIIEASTQLLARQRPRRWLLVQATQGFSPLLDPKTRSVINTGSLPLPNALRNRVALWRKRHEAMCAASGFASAADARDFVNAGHELVAFLQDELGPEWHVEYMPKPVAPPGLRLAPPNPTDP